jgi:hypothetical protein
LKALHTLLLLAPLAAVVPGAASALDWRLSADIRLVDSDGQRSLFDGGLGALRYDSAHDGLQVGRLRAALNAPLGEVWALKLDASYWGQDETHSAAVTEAYFEYRPYPIDGFRARVRIGAFMPPGSLENTAAGWSSPYTLSSSAANSWVAEEVRTVGMETKVEWLGTRLGHSVDLGLTGGLFGWNDPAGAVVATGGFSLNDFQTPLGGYIGARGSAAFAEHRIFQEIDGHAGYYVGAEARYLDRVTLLALHYDNRADPTSEDQLTSNYAWHTRYDSIGMRAQTESGWTAIIQWLKGRTLIQPDGISDLEWPFYSQFALVSRQWGRHTLSARYDEFGVDSELRLATSGFHESAVNIDGTSDFGAEDGHAWTVAYLFNQSPHWRFALEWLHVTSELANRRLLLREPTLAIENQTMFSMRYTIGSGL